MHQDPKGLTHHLVYSNRLQHDYPAACVIAQQYSSTTFISSHVHFHKGTFGMHFKNLIISFYFKLRKFEIA
jgi:hypothetical protein